MKTPEPILLTNWRSPGDIVCLTAAIRDLAVTYPGRFEIHLGGACSDLWQHNPHIARAWGTQWPRTLRPISVTYQKQLVEANATKLHFVTSFHRSLTEHLKLPIPVLQPHGDLHLSDEERSQPLVSGRYWFFVAGGKSDIPTKIWPASYAQQLVDRLVEHGISIVQGGANYPGHQHPKLTGVTSFVGQTSLRDVLRLIYHAEGVICPITFAMHAAAALHKLCVVMAGGREPWWWEGYFESEARHFGTQCEKVRVPHRYLHTLGQFDCCREVGCWKSKLSAESPWKPNECLAPIRTLGFPTYPACLAAVTPELVVEAVLSYYRDGTLLNSKNSRCRVSKKRLARRNDSCED